jgi:CheY-like chemotaxis protein
MALNNEPGNRSGVGTAGLPRHLQRDGMLRSTAESGGSGTSRSRYTVLVADDADAARYALARRLQQAGFRTVEAADGASVFRLLAAADAVVLDALLPDFDGFDICDELRRVPSLKTLPIVMVSAAFRDAERFRAAGNSMADAYLPQPVNVGDLVSLLDRLLADGKLRADQS